MEEVLKLREGLEQEAIIKEVMIGLFIILILEFIFIMSRKLHLFNQEKTYISKLQQHKSKNNQTANAASVSKVRQ
jgi:uncharacterized membrane protein